MTKKVIRYTPEQLEFIEQKQCGITRKKLAEMFTSQFGIKVSGDQMRFLCYKHSWKNGRDGQFQKGSTPPFKGTRGIKKATAGSFKKGIVPANTLPVGSERVTKDGYTLIKSREPNVYELKHRVVWEKHNGKIPDGYCVRFIDNDKSNFNISNLILIPKSVNGLVNVKNQASTTSPDLNRVILKTEELAYKLRRMSSGR